MSETSFEWTLSWLPTGVNLQSGQQGIFPSAHTVDMDYSDFDPSTPKVKQERYLLGYLGSVEMRCHKRNAVLRQAVKKIVGTSGVPKHKPHLCILEVSDQGLRMVDRKKPLVIVPSLLWVQLNRWENKYIRIGKRQSWPISCHGRPTVLILARREWSNPYITPLRATQPRIRSACAYICT